MNYLLYAIMLIAFFKLDFFIDLALLVYWKIRDLFRKKDLRLWGIWLFCGLYGQGKTMALTEYLLKMRRKYGDKIYICTNYGFKGEDFPLTTWEQLIPDYDKPIIFGYDEIQNEFSSREYRNFPSSLVTVLTQNRKGNGKQIVGTAQRFTRVDKVIRELASHVVECRTYFGRWTVTKRYDVEDYEEYLTTTDVKRKHKIPKRRYRFVQSDKMRDAYDSFQMLQTAKNKEYMGIYEKYNLNNGVIANE